MTWISIGREGDEEKYQSQSGCVFLPGIDGSIFKCLMKQIWMVEPGRRRSEADGWCWGDIKSDIKHDTVEELSRSQKAKFFGEISIVKVWGSVSCEPAKHMMLLDAHSTDHRHLLIRRRVGLELHKVVKKLNKQLHFQTQFQTRLNQISDSSYGLFMELRLRVASERFY